MEDSRNYNLITTIMFISGIIVMGSLYTALPLTAAFAEDFHVPQSVATYAFQYIKVCLPFYFIILSCKINIVFF